MGVTVLPDWGPGLGEALGRLAQGIRHAIDPEREMKKRIGEAVASGNTEIPQHLTDYLYTNGSLPPEITKYIPKDLLDSIYIGEPSPDAIRNRAASRAGGNLSPEQNTALGQGVLTGEGPIRGTVGLQVAPEIPKLIGQPPGTEPTTLGEAAAQRAISGLPAGAEAKDSLTASLYPVVQDYLTGLKQKDAENTRAGHPTNYYQRAAAEQYDLLRDEHFRMTLDDRLMFMRLRHQDQLDAIAEHESNYWVNKSGGMGSPDLWRYLLYDPKSPQRIQEIRTTGPKNAEDATLLRMQNFRDSDGANSERAFYTQSVVQRDRMLDAINGNVGKKIAPDDDSRRPSDLAALNMELAREHTPLEAYWGPSADGSDSKSKLRFRSRAHKNIEIPPEQVQYALQQADRTYSGSGLQVQQPRPAGSVAPPPKPPAQVTHTAPDTSKYNLATPAGYWQYLRDQDSVSPDSVITNRVRAKFNLPMR